MAKIVAVIGRSGSGKTSTIEYLISNLSREGFSIGSIKHVHEQDFTIDTKSKDTWRYTQAGAKIIAIIAPTEVAIIKKKEDQQIELEETIKKLEEGLDVIFLEGFHSLIAKRSDVFKIITAENEEDLERTLKGTVHPIIAITGKIAKLKPKIFNLEAPIIDMYSEGRRLVQLVKNHIRGKLDWEKRNMQEL
ncbi:MAG: molybdopterin-guanine dinucleotide biosynthesis protein B [archaeon]|nr:molybdopterin-guanine dinucleotide biosynthesis protein B [archaeon]